MSANNAVTVLRSPSAAVDESITSGSTRTAGEEVCADGLACGVNLVPHSSQNFAPGRFVAPHWGHFDASGAAHSLQNFACSRFSTPHFEQRITRPRASVKTRRCYVIRGNMKIVPIRLGSR